MADLVALLDDFAAECADLDAIVAALPAAAWALPTPAPGWTIAHQIGHLVWTDDVAALSATDPEAFAELVRQALQPLTAASAEPSVVTQAAASGPVAPAAKALTFVDEGAEQAAATPPAELLERWRRGRSALIEALGRVPAGVKLSWFGPPMSPSSMVTARLMETWAHGQDTADTLGITRTPTARLRSIAHIGVRTRNFAYMVHERPAPVEDFRVELTAPDGDLWTWGPESAAQRVTGTALDFCLLVTQRRHREDLALRASGADADEWLGIAQAFAGPSGTGRTPGQFA